MAAGSNEAQQLLTAIKYARTEGTMATLRQLQTDVFKFMRSAKNTGDVSLDDLRLLRSFLRDPFAQPHRGAPTQHNDAPTTEQNQSAATISQHSTSAMHSPVPQQPRVAQKGNQPEAKLDTQPPANKILYYRHPGTPDAARPSPDARNRSRSTQPKTPRRQRIERQSTAPKTQSVPRTQEPSSLRDSNIPTPAVFAGRKKKQTVHPPLREPSTATKFHPTNQSHESTNHRGRYSAYVTFPSAKGHSIRNNINEWLSEKGIGPHFGETYDQRLNTAQAVASMIDTTELSTRYSELRIIEDTDGMFTTNITMGISPDECWVYIEVESANNYYPQIPRIARRLIGYGTVDNSYPAWHSAAQYVEDDAVEDVFAYLTSPDRRLPIFLIGTTDDEELIGQYRENLKTWFRFLPGTAAMFMLSPSATAELSDRLPSSFAPSPWAIRTYRSNVDFEDEHDALRHRFLGQYRLNTEEHTRTRNRLGMIASEARAQVPRPSVLARAQRTIDRARNRALLRATEHSREAIRNRSNAFKKESRIQPTDQFGQLTRVEYDNYSMLRELLQVKSLTEDIVLDLAELYETRPKDEVLARLDGMTEALTSYRDQADELRSLNEYYLNEAREFENELEQNQARLRFVQRELAAAGKPEAAYSFAQDTDIFEDVSSFTDLEQLLPSLEPEGIVFTGDISSMLNIDEVDSDGTAIRRALKCIRCLLSYREERVDGNHDSSLFHYLKNPTGVFSVPIKMFASKESESTMNQFGNERVFPVPFEVDSTGWATMESHFKLGKIGQRSPRMHILDDLTRTNRIYIGYLGDHLTIASTN